MGNKLSTQNYMKARYKPSKRPSPSSSRSATTISIAENIKDTPSNNRHVTSVSSLDRNQHIQTGACSKMTSTIQELDEDRMHATHFAVKTLFDRNFAETVQHTIDFNSKHTRVLDIGCGTGTWIMDMATEFPNTQFIGIDKAPLFPAAIRPPNASFRLLDVVKGLPFEDNSFDLINSRLFLLDLRPEFWPDFIKEVLRVTKPGGLFQMMELQVIDEGDEVVQDFSTRVEEMMAKEGMDARISEKLDALLGENGFIPKQVVVKSIPLKEHVLSDEFMYVLDILFDVARWVAYAAYNISSEAEYQIAKRRYMQSKRESSTTTWHYIVGQKPVP